MISETEMNHKRQRDFFKESATSKRASRHRLPFMLHPNIPDPTAQTWSNLSSMAPPSSTTISTRLPLPLLRFLQAGDPL